MNKLPDDASADQSNCPDGYYRRTNGMVVQKPQQSATATLKTALNKRTAQEMREAASSRLDLAIDAVEAILRDSEARHSDKLAAAVFIRDTSHGKPTERVEHTVGIMQIVMEMNKHASIPLIENGKVLDNAESQVIDK